MSFTSKIKKWIAALSISLILFVGLAYTPDYFEISKNLDIFIILYFVFFEIYTRMSHLFKGRENEKQINTNTLSFCINAYVSWSP